MSRNVANVLGRTAPTAAPWAVREQQFLWRQKEQAVISDRTSRLLAKADEMAAKYVTGELTNEEAILPIESILLDLKLLYRKILAIRPKPAVSKPRRGVVYVIRCESGLYKIGQTIKIKQRYKSLQASSGRQMKVVVCKRAGRWYRAAEQHLHQVFATKRVQGEWFCLDPSDVENIGPSLDSFLAAYSAEMEAL